jgi:hypothetical protein
VIRVTQLCQISQVYHQLARDAGLVALAAAHASSDLQLTNTTWMTWVLSHAAWACVCQIASQQLKRPSPTPASNPSRLELSVCNCVLSGVMLSAQAGRGAVDRYVRRGNDGEAESTQAAKDVRAYLAQAGRPAHTASQENSCCIAHRWAHIRTIHLQRRIDAL